MKKTRSRLFTVLCIAAMMLGLAAAAWARPTAVDHDIGHEIDPNPDRPAAARTP